MNVTRALPLLLLLLLAVAPCQLRAQSQTVAHETIEGTWVGGTNAPGQWMSLQIRFAKKDAAFEGTLDGFYEATLGFDFHAIQQLRLRNVKTDSPAVRFEIPSPAGVFSFVGTLKDGVITGTAEAGNRKAALHLVRIASFNPQAYGQYLGTYKTVNSKVGITWREFGGLRMIDLASGVAQALVPASAEADTFYVQKSLLTSTASAQRVTFLKDKKGSVICFEQTLERESKNQGQRINSFKQEQVSFSNGDIKLSGTLLLPSGKGPHPAVVFVHGYGPIYRTALFERAATFTRMGVAALIYDKRGTGLSNGNWRMSATSFEDLAADALAGVQLLKNRKDINQKQIGLQGHSQAGDIIPIAAAESKDIAFVIVASGGGVKMEESVVYEKRNDLIKDGRFSIRQINDAVDLIRRVHDYVIRGIGERAQLEADYLQAQKQPWFSTTDLPQFKSFPSRDAPEVMYARKEMSFDPGVYVARVTVPVLVLLGDEDKVVPTELAEQRWRASLDKARNRNFTIEIIPGADHGMRVQHADKRIFTPDYWAIMSEWLFIQLDGVKKDSISES